MRRRLLPVLLVAATAAAVVAAEALRRSPAPDAVAGAGPAAPSPSMADASCPLDPLAQHGLPVPALDPDAGATDPTPRHAVFAGGCFWCVEGVFERLDGVLDAESGYAGGDAATADYESVCGGDTGHAEVVRVTYDPTRITYGTLLRVFFATHDPTQRDRQGPDVGTQYRSAIFWADEHQRAAAEAYLRQLAQAGAFARPLQTRLEPLTAFHPAEDHHQDFVRRNPSHPYIRAQALPKLEKLERLLPERTRPAPGAR